MIKKTNTLFKPGSIKIFVRNHSEYKQPNARRVVCTGIGVICPLGIGHDFAWNKLISGSVAVKKFEKVGFESIPSKVAAFIPVGDKPGCYHETKQFNISEKKYLSQNMMYALLAAEEALKDSHWKPTEEYEKQRTGVAVGCGMVDLETIANTSTMFSSRGYKRVSPYFVPKILTNLGAGHISIKYGFQGPNHCVSTACATGSHAIGDSLRFIRNGDADVMVCGGTEAAIVPISMAGFSRARALSTSFTHLPESSSRPFDKDRDGFVIGEGSAILVLEEYEHAIRRGANIYAEILGYGLSGDAHHMTAAHDSGIGAYLSMKAALSDAGLTSKQVSYINAHATSTPLGDVIENRAIKRLFKDHAYNLKISSSKGAIGHLLGAAGAVESAFTILSLYHKIIPPTMNVFNLTDEFDLDYVANEACDYKTINNQRRIALKNSFGFGGTNATLCFGQI